jgi:hypothetical protein
MRVERARPGARGLDSLSFSEGGTAGEAAALRAAGVDCVYGYLGVISLERVGFILDAGMAFLPVTLADRFSGPDAVLQLQRLSMPSGVAVTLDLEGPAILRDPPAIIAVVDAWGQVITNAGFNPTLYVGVPQPLTSQELWDLGVHGYWRGQGSIRDRFNNLAEPTGGWWAVQAWPSVKLENGVFVEDPGGPYDLDMLTADYRRRLPNWVVAS